LPEVVKSYESPGVCSKMFLPVKETLSNYKLPGGSQCYTLV
jgi:hypothetical protein